MNAKAKIETKPFALSIVVLLLLIQVIIQEHVALFQYFDELVTVVCLVILLMHVGRRREIAQILIMMGILTLIGICGNLLFPIQKNVAAIFTDIGNMFKGFIVFLTFNLIFSESKKQHRARKTIDYLDIYCKVLVVPGVILALLNLFVDIGMHTEYVYGLRSFHYIFLRMGNLRSACVSMLIIMTAHMSVLSEKQKKRQFIYIVLTVLLMISTLRSRAFLYAVVYFGGYLYFVKGKKIRIKLWQIVLIVAAGLYIGLPKLNFFFRSSTAARGVLLRYGITTGTTYFPVGAGFGSYGTFAARQYWSPLYNTYSFSNYYGLSRQFGDFLTDDYWPAIIGEFGFFGTLLMATIIVAIFRVVIRSTKSNSISRFSALFGLIALYTASLVSSSFFHTSAVCIMALVGIASALKGEEG